MQKNTRWTKQKAKKYALDAVARMIQHVIETDRVTLPDGHAAALVEEQLLEIAEQMHRRAKAISD